MTSCGDAIPGVDSKKSSAPSASTTRLTAAFFAGGNDYVAIKKEKTVAETKPPAAERQLPTNKDEPKVVAPERKHRHHHHRSAADTEDGKTKDADGGSTKKKCCKKRKTSEPAECPKKRKRTDAADADKADESRRDAVPPASEDKGNAAKVLPVEEAVNDDDEQTAPDPPPRKKRRGDDREDAISVSARNIGEDVFGSIPPESSDDRGSVLSSSFFLTDGKKDDDAAPIQIDDSGDDEECAEIPGDMHLPSLTISAPIASVTTTDSRRSATPYGLPTARNAGNWSTLPKLGRPGDEWTPFATTRALIALRERIDGLVITVKEMRSGRGKKSSATVASETATALAPPAAGGPTPAQNERVDPETRTSIRKELEEISSEIRNIGDSAHECFSEAVHAMMFRKANPEVLGYGSLLQTAPEPPEWARRDQQIADRKRKAATVSATLKKSRAQDAKKKVAEHQQQQHIIAGAGRGDGGSGGPGKKSAVSRPGSALFGGKRPTAAPKSVSLTAEQILGEGLPLRPEDPKSAKKT